MPHRTQIPSYRHQKSRDLAVVRLNGKDHYLGPYNSAESREKYHRLIAEHLAQKDNPVVGPASGQPLSVQRLCLAYTDYPETYDVKDGKVSGEVACINAAFRPLLKLYARTLASEFGPRALKLVREEFVRAGLMRVTVNHHVFRTRQMFRWAVENELLPPAVHQALTAVPSLRKGRTTAKESPPVRLVDEAAVDASLPFMPAPVAAMVKLQRLTGRRPAEICSMWPRDVDYSSRVWCYTRATSGRANLRPRERLN